MQPVYSIIVPCYNQGRYIQELLESTARATLLSHEVIIVDDGSTEPATKSILESVQSKYEHQTLKLMSQRNGGLSSARNLGLRAATGRYIQLLDADDLLYPEALDFRAEALTSTGADIALCGYVTCNEERTAFSQPESSLPDQDFTFPVFAKGWERGICVPIHCGLFRRAALGSHWFNESLKAKEDWLFWMGLASAKKSFTTLKRPGAVYRLHAEGMTRDLRRMGVAWLNAISHAKRAFPEFDDECVTSGLDHFRAFYLRHFWMSEGEAFPSRFYDALLFGRA